MLQDTRLIYKNQLCFYDFYIISEKFENEIKTIVLQLYQKIIYLRINLIIEVQELKLENCKTLLKKFKIQINGKISMFMNWKTIFLDDSIPQSDLQSQYSKI